LNKVQRYTIRKDGFLIERDETRFDAGFGRKMCTLLNNIFEIVNNRPDSSNKPIKIPYRIYFYRLIARRTI